jgi:hypothetical protein
MPRPRARVPKWILVQCPLCKATTHVLPPTGEATCNGNGKHNRVVMTPKERAA